MNRTYSAALAATVLSLAATGASAEICRWKDANGRTQYSDTPPAGVVCEGQIKKPRPSSGAAAPAAQPSAGSKNYQELDMEFRKRRTEKEEAEKKAQLQKEAAEQKKAACDEARARVAGLQSGGRVAKYDANGQLQYLGDDDIKKSLADAQRAASEACK